jgi:hypothetical protein
MAGWPPMLACVFRDRHAGVVRRSPTGSSEQNEPAAQALLFLSVGRAAVAIAKCAVVGRVWMRDARGCGVVQGRAVGVAVESGKEARAWQMMRKGSMAPAERYFSMSLRGQLGRACLACEERT